MTPAYSGRRRQGLAGAGRRVRARQHPRRRRVRPALAPGRAAENRHKAYEDFAAVAEDLIARKVTTPKHLGIMGGSNGGLLMGNMLTQYPELFGAIVCQVPLLDMKRYSHLLAGASWMAEYGDPDTPADWAFIQTFSPYQNVFDPAKDLPAGAVHHLDRDDRVHPGHARKMMARMLEQGHDVLYYENIEGGHGGAANNAQAAHMQALAYTFLWQKLSQRRVLLAARRHPQEPGDARLPEGRERLRRRGAGADQAAAGQALREIVGRIKQDDSAVPYRERGYWYYTRFETGQDYPIARRKGQHEGAERGPARRAGDGQGQRLLQRSATGKSARTTAARLRAEDASAAASTRSRSRTSPTGKTLADEGRQRRAQPRLGRRQPHHLLHREGPGDPAQQAGEGARARHAGAADKLVYEEKDDSFYMGVGRTSDDKYHLHLPAEHGQQRAALHQRGRARARSRCWRRASASSATRPTTSAAAGSSAPTGTARRTTS
jgi:protease II